MQHIDSFSVFLNRAAKTPLLTHEDEIMLGRQVRAWLDNPDSDETTIRTGRRAKQRLIQANIRLVVHVAKSYQNRGLEIPDVVQEGCLGLHRAAELFDPSKGYRFSTYAYPWIHQAMKRGIEVQANSVRLPNHIHELLTSARKESALFAKANLGKKPTLRQLAERLVEIGRLKPPAYYPKGTDPMEIAMEKLTHAFQISRSLYSLNAILPNMDEQLEVVDALYCSGPRPEDAALTAAQAELVLQGMDILPDDEREVIVEFFGLDGWPPRTMSEIARRHGGDFAEARGRVRRIQSRAIRRLRRWIEAEAVDLVREA